jgi:GxxExxY protein
MSLYAHPANAVSQAVIGSAIEAHRALGPGLLESAYQRCLKRELCLRSIPYRSEVELPVSYKGERLDCGYRLDLVVAECLVVEVKSVERLLPVHEAQLLTYLRLAALPIGLLINFNARALRMGVRRLMLGGSSVYSAPPCEPTG